VTFSVEFEQVGDAALTLGTGRTAIRARTAAKTTSIVANAKMFFFIRSSYGALW
jgi:hypothetical protein